MSYRPCTRMTDAGWVPILEAATRLGMSRRTLASWAAAGRIEAQQWANMWYLSPAAMAALDGSLPPYPAKIATT